MQLPASANYIVRMKIANRCFYKFTTRRIHNHCKTMMSYDVRPSAICIELRIGTKHKHGARQ